VSGALRKVVDALADLSEAEAAQVNMSLPFCPQTARIAWVSPSSLTADLDGQMVHFAGEAHEIVVDLGDVVRLDVVPVHRMDDEIVEAAHTTECAQEMVQALGFTTVDERAITLQPRRPMPHAVSPKQLDHVVKRV
jgi:hypothetical protein